MRKPKLIESYLYLSNDEVSPFAHSVVRQTTASTFIKKGNDLAAPLLAALVLYDTDLDTVDTFSPAQTSYRDTLRSEVVNQLGRLAKRLNLDYTGDETALLSSGLTMSDPNTAVRPTVSTEQKPKIELVDSKTPHCLCVQREYPTGSVQAIVRYTTDPTLDEENWKVALSGGKEREIGPFNRGDEVFAKSAVLTTGTTEPVYSDVVSRIVQ